MVCMPHVLNKTPAIYDPCLCGLCLRNGQGRFFYPATDDFSEYFCSIEKGRQLLIRKFGQEAETICEQAWKRIAFESLADKDSSVDPKRLAKLQEYNDYTLECQFRALECQEARMDPIQVLNFHDFDRQPLALASVRKNYIFPNPVRWAVNAK